jgi:hypothetical protein
VVIHTIADTVDNQTLVTFAGHIPLPGADSDAVVLAAGGVSVHVEAEALSQDDQQQVRVWLKPAGETARFRVTALDAPQVEATATEMRPIPGWEFAGLFTWEHRRTTQTTTYRPMVSGMGMRNFPSDTDVTVNWYIDNDLVPASAAGTHTLATGHHLDYTIDAEDQSLRLSNKPEEGYVEATVTATAYDGRTIGSPDGYLFAVDGKSEGWGQDYYDYMDLWRKITNPVTKDDIVLAIEGGGWPPRRGPRLPDRLAQLWQPFNTLADSNPAAAEQLRAAVTDHARVLRRIFGP